MGHLTTAVSWGKATLKLLTLRMISKSRSDLAMGDGRGSGSSRFGWLPLLVEKSAGASGGKEKKLAGMMEVSIACRM
jgi:hypothetical protein